MAKEQQSRKANHPNQCHCWLKNRRNIRTPSDTRKVAFELQTPPPPKLRRTGFRCFGLVLTPILWRNRYSENWFVQPRAGRFKRLKFTNPENLLRSKFSLSFWLVFRLFVCEACMQLIWMLYATYIDLYSTLNSCMQRASQSICGMPLRVVTPMEEFGNFDEID